MCGRYAVFTEAEIIEMNAIVAEVSRRFGPGAVSTGEIFPTNMAPVLTLENKRLAPQPVRWGFPAPGGKGTLINARCESVLEKRSFAKALLTLRCVIPSTGFYEWTYAGRAETQLSLFPDAGGRRPSPKDPKVKLLFTQPGDSMLYMAGMIAAFPDEKGVPKDAFCILTTAARHTVARFHERMPVILSGQECEDWISSETFMKVVLAREGPDLVWSPAV